MSDLTHYCSVQQQRHSQIHASYFEGSVFLKFDQCLLAIKSARSILLRPVQGIRERPGSRESKTVGRWGNVMPMEE